MADMYDAIEVKGNLRYRLNKVFISKDKVPENIRKQLTADNIIDDNGIEIVSQKTEAAKQPDESNTLPRKDQDQSTSDEPSEDPGDGPQEPASEDDDLVIDDSANEENQNDEGDGDGNSTTSQTPKDTTAPTAQTVATDPNRDGNDTPSEPAKKKVSKGSERATRSSAEDEPVARFRSIVPQSSVGMGFPRKNGKTVDVFDLKTPHTHTKLVGGHTVPLSAESFKTKSEAQIIRRIKELGFETIDFNRLEAEQAREGVTDQDLLDQDDEEDDITTA